MIESKIHEILSGIKEPVLNESFGDLNFIKNIALVGDTLKLTLGISDINYNTSELTSFIESEIRKQLPSVSKVEIGFTAGVTEHFNKAKSAVLPEVKNTIAVASGKGGVGKSTVTVNVACALSLLGAKVGLIDADIYGPSIPIMFGVSSKPGIIKQDGKNKLVPVEKHGVKIMSIGFLAEPGSAVIWRGPMASSALKQFISDVVWGELDFLLFDMPPGTGDIQLTLSQTLPLTGAVIVTTPQEISLADARKGYKMFQKVNVPTFGIIENMSCYQMPDGSKDYIFGQGGGKKMADEYSVKLLGEIPIDTAIRESGDKGFPIALDKGNPASEVYRQIAATLIKEVNIKNFSDKASKELEIII